MQLSGLVPQLRTTDLPASIAFYTGRLGLALAFRYQDFYAGIRAGPQRFHLKRSDQPDPSIPFVRAAQHFHLCFNTPDIEAAADAVTRAGIPLLQDVHDTPWGTAEFVIEDDQGHTLYFGQVRA